MKLSLDTAEFFVPDGRPPEEALARTTHLAIGAHQDDLEIMAMAGILRCFQHPSRWFTGVVVTDGHGSARNGLYKDHTDEAMQAVRRKEQKKAAVVGEYAAQVLLDYPSAAVKDAANESPVEDLALLLEVAGPDVVYTHNLADKHDTHVAVALRTIDALRRLSPARRPAHVYGCEVWRSLDWLVDTDKIVMDCSARENLQAALVGVFDSQISGGKRYDLATAGRFRANATYYESHSTDTATGMVYAMDLTPLIQDPFTDVGQYVQEFVEHFSQDVGHRLAKLQEP
jgi:LmbE family N-acetylglucosaminyl deacetylase